MATIIINIFKYNKICMQYFLVGNLNVCHVIEEYYEKNPGIV